MSSTLNKYLKYISAVSACHIVHHNMNNLDTLIEWVEFNTPLDTFWGYVFPANHLANQTYNTNDRHKKLELVVN